MAQSPSTKKLTGDEFYAFHLKALQSLIRLPGFVHTETLMAFWGINRSGVSRRMKWIEHRGLAVVRSEHLEGSKRWYWIDPYINENDDRTREG